MPEADANALAAGWFPDNGQAPFVHGTPPLNGDWGTNGIKLVRSSEIKKIIPRGLGGSVIWPDVLAEFQKAVGFREGPNNENPWGPEQGIFHASYCCSAACIIPWHHGYKWWPESQFGEKGDAYVPYHVKHAQAHGEWRFDHSSSGDPCDLVPSDQAVYVWPGEDGAGDHIETVVVVYSDGTFLTIGANTGRPEGVYYVHRDRKYFLGRIRPSFYANPAPPPVTPGGKTVPAYPFHTTVPDFADWIELDGHSWLLTIDGATYASPGSPGVPGVNAQSYWTAPTHRSGPNSAAKLHVRNENGKYVSCIEDTDGNLFRPDGGSTFRTH